MSRRSCMLPGWPRRPWAPRTRAGMSLGTGKGGHGLRAQSRRWQSPATFCRRTKVSAGGGRLHHEDECPLEMPEGACGRGNVQVRANTGLKRGRKSGASHRLMVTCRRRRPDTLEPSGPQPVEHAARHITQLGELDLRPAFQLVHEQPAERLFSGLQ